MQKGLCFGRGLFVVQAKLVYLQMLVIIFEASSI